MGDVVSCGYAPIVAIVADHDDWPAPGWYGGTITRDATLVSPQQCQVCLITNLKLSCNSPPIAL